MPRPTKTFLKLTNEVNPKLLTSEETKERLKVFSQLMDQYSRTRHSDRKKKYKSQLTTVFQRICLQLEDSARDNKDLEAEVRSLNMLAILTSTIALLRATTSLLTSTTSGHLESAGLHRLGLANPLSSAS